MFVLSGVCLLDIGPRRDFFFIWNFWESQIGDVINFLSATAGNHAVVLIQFVAKLLFFVGAIACKVQRYVLFWNNENNFGLSYFYLCVMAGTLRSVSGSEKHGGTLNGMSGQKKLPRILCLLNRNARERWKGGKHAVEYDGCCGAA